MSYDHRRLSFFGPCLLGLVALAALGGAARADDDVAQARRHFEAGTRAFNVGEFDNAAKEYREAYKLKPDPAMLYNVAQSYRLAKNVEQALFFYRSYRRNSTDLAHRQETDARIAALELQLKQQQAPPNDVVNRVPAIDGKAPDPSPSAPKASEPAPVTTQLELTTPAPPPPKPPLYRTWWLWTATGVVVVGAGLGIGLGLGLNTAAPSTALGNHKVF
jgi:tetratricopeptide (TPR) repeat protein